LSVEYTPYDQQMASVSPILNASTDSKPDQTSLVAINQWMIHLRAMPYCYSRRWKTPVEVNSEMMGDCKGKAVALYEKLRINGARDARLVIGKLRARDRRTHAWVEWETGQGIFLLDPTLNWTATRAKRLDNSTYIPLYAYEGGHKYRALNPVLSTAQDSWSHQVASR
jgi:transglutaminase-like putative cysteine protease